MRTEVSRDDRFRWNDSYIGRGLNKVERVFRLRHHCFNLVVLHNAFMIHSTSVHLAQSVSDEAMRERLETNLLLFKQQQRAYLNTMDSCTRPKLDREGIVDGLSRMQKWITDNVATLLLDMYLPGRLDSLHRDDQIQFSSDTI